MLEDSTELRQFIKEIYANFVVKSIAKKSGQRVVYFGSFQELKGSQPGNAHLWGEVVLKISEATSRASVSYIQKEVEILKMLQDSHYPRLYFSEVITTDPSTEEPLSPIRFVSIEEKLVATPLSDKIYLYNSEKKVIDFLIKIVSALKGLWNHPKKLVHRDLKPDNILIKENDDIYIIDLGILREEGSAGVTNSLCSFGPCTPYYASPEQAINDKRNITFKSDLFSLGVIAYEMLSKHNPFHFSDESNYPDEVLERVCTHIPPPLDNLGVSEELSNIIFKMMNKEPYKRYRTPEKILDELEKLR
ncbi:serine/threonine protein kinase [Vibrio parahaemolyticus]|nr:serine/threonine protein kinase [Vibrio alginolyticus]EHK2853389.1 serine/threonine protein kinase [Vibrio parahaemolyticus]EIN9983218.1 serine/threonine protein kinase [Vibrio parahaemolyticus]EJU8945836.1 serine/threonine protein kinase [Vibrio parahaemolyticus]ELA7219240.1 serine/threonine protein kinase [Vibrio parahaemolyticus]